MVLLVVLLPGVVVGRVGSLGLLVLLLLLLVLVLVGVVMGVVVRVGVCLRLFFVPPPVVRLKAHKKQGAEMKEEETIRRRAAVGVYSAIRRDSAREESDLPCSR